MHKLHKLVDKVEDKISSHRQGYTSGVTSARPYNNQPPYTGQTSQPYSQPQPYANQSPYTNQSFGQPQPYSGQGQGQPQAYNNQSQYNYQPSQPAVAQQQYATPSPYNNTPQQSQPYSEAPTCQYPSPGGAVMAAVGNGDVVGSLQCLPRWVQDEFKRTARGHPEWCMAYALYLITAKYSYHIYATHNLAPRVLDASERRDREADNELAGEIAKFEKDYEIQCRGTFGTGSAEQAIVFYDPTVNTMYIGFTPALMGAWRESWETAVRVNMQPAKEMMKLLSSDPKLTPIPEGHEFWGPPGEHRYGTAISYAPDPSTGMASNSGGNAGLQPLYGAQNTGQWMSVQESLRICNVHRNVLDQHFKVSRHLEGYLLGEAHRNPSLKFVLTGYSYGGAKCQMAALALKAAFLARGIHFDRRVSVISWGGIRWMDQTTRRVYEALMRDDAVHFTASSRSKSGSSNAAFDFDPASGWPSQQLGYCDPHNMFHMGADGFVTRFRGDDHVALNDHIRTITSTDLFQLKFLKHHFQYQPAMKCISTLLSRQ